MTHFLEPRTTAFQAQVALGSWWKVDPLRAGPTISQRWSGRPGPRTAKRSSLNTSGTWMDVCGGGEGFEAGRRMGIEEARKPQHLQWQQECLCWAAAAASPGRDPPPMCTCRHLVVGTQVGAALRKPLVKEVERQLVTLGVGVGAVPLERHGRVPDEHAVPGQLLRQILPAPLLHGRPLGDLNMYKGLRVRMVEVGCHRSVPWDMGWRQRQGLVPPQAHGGPPHPSPRYGAHHICEDDRAVGQLVLLPELLQGEARPARHVLRFQPGAVDRHVGAEPGAVQELRVKAPGVQGARRRVRPVPRADMPGVCFLPAVAEGPCIAQRLQEVGSSKPQAVTSDRRRRPNSGMNMSLTTTRAPSATPSTHL